MSVEDADASRHRSESAAAIQVKMGSDRTRQPGLVLETWNRKLHYYLGLYLILFLWLFSFTGLLLNHPRWAISRIPNDPGSAYACAISMPAGDTDLARANDVARQLGLRGEIDWPQAPQAPERLDFAITSPKRAIQVKVDLAQERAAVQQVNRSFWAAFRITHTFSGSRYNVPGTSRDWILTSVWVFAMDLLAVGLLVMVFGSYYMWYRLKPNRMLGWIVLAAGLVSCGFFALGGA